ncbi:MAG: hypothetical protein ACRD28_10380 [Acidobacteriaceae bacterium]
MKRLKHSTFRLFPAVGLLLGVLIAPTFGIAQPTPKASSGFNAYVAMVVARLSEQHRLKNGFLTTLTPEDVARLQRGEFVIDQRIPPTGTGLSGAMLHDWCGTAFVRGATANEFARLMRDFSDYPRVFAPQVVDANVLVQHGDGYTVRMRLRQRHVIPVVLDATYDVDFRRIDAYSGYSVSRSTKIQEINSAGTESDRAPGPGKDHGFLWRQNTYWSYEQRNGGLYLRVESVSLSRSIPTGLGWLVRPYLESVPRESMEFTLRAVSRALPK